MTFLSEFAVLLGLTAVNAFLSGAEIALLSVRKSRLQELADAGGNRAAAALALRKHPEEFLATVQVGITIVGASAGAFGGVVLEQPVAALLARIGLGAWADRLALALVIALVSALSIVLGELVPKSLALRFSERFALLAAPVLLLLARVTRPVVWLLTAASNVFLRPFHDRTTFTESRLSAEELRQLVEEAADAGSVDSRAGEIATRALDLGSLPVSAVMVPRGSVASIPVAATAAEVREALARRHFGRLPVTGESEDDVVGYVLARELYAQLLDGRVDLRGALRRLPFFPERMKAVQVLRSLQAARTHIGAVVDEHGVMVGLVSVEDLAEEVLGEIVGESETPVPVLQAEGPGTWLAPGTTPVHEINRELGTDLPLDPGWTTLAGLVLHHTGSLPTTGTRVPLDGGVEAEIVDATNRRIGRIRLRLPGPHVSAG